MTINRGRAGANVRRTLLASAASLGLVSLMAPTAAWADDTAPTNYGPEAQAASGSITPVDPTPQIIIADPGTPTTARDPDNVTGVAQMVVDQGGGFVGLCTATLINPRTVIFAAHCVNGAAASTYGAGSGGTGIGFGFETNTRANAAGQTDELVRWLLGGTGGAGRFQTNVAQAFYNSNYVTYNPLSLEPNAQKFLYGDVAIAALDTAAGKIPTWALLFSRLPAPNSVGASGTGYHVTIDGYGTNGTGILGGNGGIDYRRRIAENIIGGLTSLDNFESFLFGGNNTTRPQNLYWLDFDDPRRGTASASPYDFNAWRDNATPNEGITGPGDSGGPLILDTTYAKKVVIGVLSGGYSRFFGGQPSYSFGAVSFYQPLYLYWDWIAANNPYHYVSANAGNANWTDPTHWTTNLDPNYQILSNGQLVNGVPTTPGGTVNDTSGQFGQECFQSGGASDCIDWSTGVETYDPSGHPIGTAGNGAGRVSINDLLSSPATVGIDGDGNGSQSSQVVSGTPDPQTTQSNQQNPGLPAATLANGLPGATNFVPNNYDGDRVNSVAPRYFDVTLGAAGTTTLDTSVVIDRLTINGLNTALNITSTGSLFSNIDITQTLGTLTVNGSLGSSGDFLMMVGGLSGTGRITTPYFTSVLGTIAPGTAGTIGTLSFAGNVVLASGNTYLVDLGANGASDRIAVLATPAGGGTANVGGMVRFNPTTTLRASDTYTILTASSVTGTFATQTQFSAILRPSFVYSPTSVQVRIDALPYSSVITPSDQTQSSYAMLLDGNRPQASTLSGIYTPLDMQNAQTIQATLDSLNPSSETTGGSNSVSQSEALTAFFADRLGDLDPSASMGGTVSMIGRPIELASLSLAGMPVAPEARGDTTERSVKSASLPDTMRIYLAGGYINGNSAASVGAAVGGRDQFDGWFLSTGLEANIGSHSVGGIAFSYSQLNGTSATPGQLAKTDLFEFTLYGKVDVRHGLMFDGQFSTGLLAANTTRTGIFLGTPYTLRSSEHPLSVNADFGLSKVLPIGSFSLTPRAAIRLAHVSFDTVSETGAAFGLTYYRTPLDSLEGRLGLTLNGTRGTFRPMLSATYVHEFQDRAQLIAANFVGGIGGNALFQLNGTDHDWVEIGGGLTWKGSRVDLTAKADTTVARSDVSYQTYRATATIHF